jgi:hypothetical protein
MAETRESRRRIGNSTWTIIHSYPYGIRDADGAHEYLMLFSQLLELYPCDVCRRHIAARLSRWRASLREILEDSSSFGGDASGGGPPEHTINAIALWAFRVHNEVTRLVVLLNKKSATLSSNSTTFLRLERTLDEAIQAQRRSRREERGRARRRMLISTDAMDTVEETAPSSAAVDEARREILKVLDAAYNIVYDVTTFT